MNREIAGPSVEAGAGVTSCVLERRAWEGNATYLRRFPDIERGGLGFGFRQESRVVLLGYLWPRQLVRSGGLCAIDPADLGVVVPHLAKLREEVGLSAMVGIVSWVHTHPNMHLFLSGTDQRTLAGWRAVLPDVVALVVDVFGAGGSNYCAFDGDERKIPGKVEEVPLDPAWETFWQRLLESLPDALTSLGSPPEALSTPVGTWISPELGA